jgi:hypothetical protein
MLETFTALLLAHVLADFVLQTGWMVRRKRGAGMAAHGALVLATALLALGQWDRWEIYALAAVHIAIDAGKAALPARRRATLAAFLTDQALHLATLLIVARQAPDLWAGGLWADMAWLPGAMALAAGLILTTRAGGFAIGYLMAPWADIDLPRGLPDGGRLIGILERGLIFIFVLAGEPGGIGFLIAAKSVLRFDTAREDTRAGEYVIIGTLASFGWALAAAYATLGLLGALPPLHIAVPAP